MYSPGYGVDYEPAADSPSFMQAFRDSVATAMQNQSKDATTPAGGGQATGTAPVKGADVVTASGQRAAADGTPIGPSGKKAFHNSDSPTRKKAVDGAKAQGDGAVATDAATPDARRPQQKHFHGVKRNGKRVTGPRKTHFTVRGTKPGKPTPKKPDPKAPQ